MHVQVIRNAFHAFPTCKESQGMRSRKASQGQLSHFGQLSQSEKPSVTPYVVSFWVRQSLRHAYACRVFPCAEQIEETLTRSPYAALCKWGFCLRQTPRFFFWKCKGMIFGPAQLCHVVNHGKPTPRTYQKWVLKNLPEIQVYGIG